MRVSAMCFFVGLAASGMVFEAAGQTFTRQSGSVPGTDRGASRSVNWVDVNNDGYPDLFVSNGLEGGQNNQLYINNGPDSSFSFQKVFSAPIVLDDAPSDGSSWGDIDNDGDLDAFVVNWYDENNLLYRNNGDGTFVQAVGEVPVSDGGYSETCVWGDADNDGDLDLYVTNSGSPTIGARPNFLYLNNGDGTFARVTTGTIVTDASYSRGASWIDYDMDGDVDMFVVNERNQANQLYKNLLVENGVLSFDRITTGALVTGGASSWSPSWGDFDNDGDEDLFVANGWPNGQNDKLYVNNDDGIFTAVTTGPVVTDGAFSGCGAWGDYDNDGDLDLFVTTGYSGSPTANLLYRNQLIETGTATFELVTTGDIVTATGDSYGTAWEDYNNDGFLDLFVARTMNEDQQNLLYRNDATNGNHWLRIRTQGTVSNRTGIGARISVKAVIGGSPVWQSRTIMGQTGYCGQSLIAHFGLGDAVQADSVLVLWPSGVIDVYTGVSADALIDAEEGQTVSVEGSNQTIPDGTRLFQNYPNPFNPTTTISFELAEERFVRLDLFDMLGRHIQTLLSERRQPGVHRVSLTGEDLPSSGVYVYRMAAGSSLMSRTLVYLK